MCLDCQKLWYFVQVRIDTDCIYQYQPYWEDIEVSLSQCQRAIVIGGQTIPANDKTFNNTDTK